MNSRCNDRVELSVIVPILNEEKRLPVLFDMLRRQTGVRLELMLCDGGSGDASARLVQSLQADFPFPCHFLSTAPGRGVQLNAGAARSRGEYLLFLHADSRFTEADALQVALQGYRHEAANREAPVAGRFRLKFEDAPVSLLGKMAYWEVKAGLDRPGCTHGDQGFFMHRKAYQSVGPFVEDWPLFEDTFFAEAIRSRGCWILLPAELHTSARRFDSEGLSRRQTLNALLMNFRDIGWRAYFETAKSIYLQQLSTGQLRLRPFLLGIQEQLAGLSFSDRIRLWYRTGRYVRSNAWQLLLAGKIRSGGWGTATPPARIEAALNRFDRLFDTLTRNPVGYTLAALLTWCWFQLLCFREK